MPNSPTPCRWLVLVPTGLEREHLDLLPAADIHVALSGFGPVAAAASAAAAIAAHAPARVLLLGIAGSFDEERFALGTARTFDAVAMDGVGVGEGPERLLPSALGFPQLATTHPPIFERVELEGEAGLLVTTPAASADATEATQRRARFPEALAEDMEGFGVALACRLFGRPLTILRGASNRTGDRESARWQVRAALLAASARARALLSAPN